MESWRRAWRGNAPVEPLKDTEWVQRRKDFIESRQPGLNASDELTATAYRRIQSQWLIDHVDVLEEAGEIDPDTAAYLR